MCSSKIYATTLTSVGCATFILPRKGQRGEALNGRWMDTAGGYSIFAVLWTESQLLFAWAKFRDYSVTGDVAKGLLWSRWCPASHHSLWSHPDLEGVLWGSVPAQPLEVSTEVSWLLVGVAWSLLSKHTASSWEATFTHTLTQPDLLKLGFCKRPNSRLGQNKQAFVANDWWVGLEHNWPHISAETEIPPDPMPTVYCEAIK